jgi:hypothetical protein
MQPLKLNAFPLRFGLKKGSLLLGWRAFFHDPNSW